MTKQLSARPVTAGLVAVACLALMVANGNAKKPGETTSYSVPKATCGPGDHPETALQGQVPAALRAAGFKGFNCNLELIGQSRGEGANWQSAEFLDKNGHRCGYHGTASPDRSLPGRQHLGVPVIDLTNPTNPTPTGYLQTTSMLDPWESMAGNKFEADDLALFGGQFLDGLAEFAGGYAAGECGFRVHRLFTDQQGVVEG